MQAFEYFKAFFNSKTVVATTAALAVLYYFIIEYVISLNATDGVVFITTPQILIYLLALSSAVLLTISIHSIRLSLSRIQMEIDGVASAATSVIGGVIAGCNCAVPILSSAMYLLALNAATVSTVLAFVSNYQIEIFAALILFNFVTSFHHLSALSRTCTIKSGKLVRKKK
ncbi:MAG: hypothetical protein ACREBF_04635 [Candidatus Micrarchaeales archaeon]